jgi:hypothetical protein
MQDPEIDALLKAQRAQEVDPALLASISRTIGASLHPVRPLPAPWALSGALALLCGGIGVGGGVWLEPYGYQDLGVWQRAAILTPLGLFVVLAAMCYVREMIPGSPRRVSPVVLLGAGSAAFALLVALLFHGYSTESFVEDGMVCLRLGLEFAVPTGLLGWLLMRRGFAVDRVAAGLAAGTLAGLAGLSMLELHCPNFEAPHVMLWHTAVLLLSGGAGALLSKLRG